MAKPPRLMLLAGVVALMGATATAPARAESPNRAGTVTAVAGPVSLVRPASNPQPLKFRDALYWRDVVEAHKAGIARVLLGGKTTVTVRELSSLTLREEKQSEGVRYVVDLVSGRVRASVAQMLMRPGDQVEVWTWNTTASVRGTDFIVETAEQPVRAGAFGLLGAPEVVQALAERGAPVRETVVVTLSGVVEVSNRLGGTGRVERIGAYEAVRLSGRQDPVRFQVSSDQVRVLLQGLTPPRPQQARSGDQAESVAQKVEGVALRTSSPTLKEFGQAGGNGSRLDGSKVNNNGKGLALGQVSAGAGGIGLGQTSVTGNLSQAVPLGLVTKGGIPPGQIKKIP